MNYDPNAAVWGLIVGAVYIGVNVFAAKLAERKKNKDRSD
jgi:hypothetical protein